jgi:hypothetical protein
MGEQMVYKMQLIVSESQDFRRNIEKCMLLRRGYNCLKGLRKRIPKSR